METGDTLPTSLIFVVVMSCIVSQEAEEPIWSQNDFFTLCTRLLHTGAVWHTF